MSASVPQRRWQFPLHDAERLAPLAMTSPHDRPPMSGSRGPLPALAAVRPTTGSEQRPAGFGAFPLRPPAFTPPFATSSELIRPVVPRRGYLGAVPSRDEQHGGLETKRRRAEQTEEVDRSTTNDTVPAADVASNQPRRRVQTQRRREQCRANQARYRERQNRRLQHVQESTACLREQVQLLGMLRSAALQGGDRDVAFASRVVRELFARFASGLSGSSIKLPLFSTAEGDNALPTPSFSFKSECNDTYLKQVSFLRAVLAPDAQLGGGLCGPDAVLEQWWRYSCFFNRVSLALTTIDPVPALEQGDAVRVLSTGTIAVTVTRHTIVQIFPHLQRTLLGDRLLDQRLEFSIRADFAFSPSTASVQRIVEIIVEVDVVPELLRVLGDVQDVQTTLDGAFLSPQGFVGGLLDHPSGNSFLQLQRSADQLL